MEPELLDYSRQFRDIGANVDRLLDGLTPQQLTWRRAGRAWSIADCLNHLVVTGSQSLARMREAMARARTERRLASGPFRYPILQRLFVRLMDAPPRMRLRAPSAYLPAPDLEAGRVVAAFFRLQEELIRTLEEADGIDLARVKVGNPVSRWFRLSLGQELAFTAAHERRHLWQAARVREQLPTGV